MIGLVFDACRYLQDNGKWEKAAWLAKIRLNEEEYFEIIKRWCDHLYVTERKVKSIKCLWIKLKKIFSITVFLI